MVVMLLEPSLVVHVGPVRGGSHMTNRLAANTFQTLSGLCCETGEKWVVNKQTNKQSYSASISACEKGSQWVQALALLRGMPGRRLEPSAVSYSASISACEKGSQGVQALTLLRGLPGRRLETNAASYNASIRACGKGSQWLQALAWLRKVHDRRLE